MIDIPMEDTYYQRNRDRVWERNQDRADEIREYNRQYYLRNKTRLNARGAELREKRRQVRLEAKRVEMEWHIITTTFNHILLD